MSAVLDPDLITVRFIAFSEAGRHENALALVRDQIGHHLDSERLWYFMALGLANTGELAEAERAVHKALALAPDLLPALVLLGEILRLQGRTDEAVGVAHHAAARHPDDATAHLAVAAAHFARHSSETDLRITLQAALHTMKLSREYDDAFALAARAADLLGRKGEALDLLREGLSGHPTSSVLLAAAEVVRGSRRVVGDRAPLLRSVLAGNPFDDGSAEALRRLAFGSLRRLLYLPWLQGILFALSAGLALPHRVGAAGLALALAGGAVGFFLLAVRRLERRLPRGYLREELRSSPRARKTIWLAGAAEVWVSASALWIALSGGSQPAAAALVLAVLPVVASQHLLSQGEYPKLVAGWAEADVRMRRYYCNRQVQAYVSTRWIAWAGLILGIAGLSVSGLSESETPAVAGAGLCLAMLLWLARAGYLIRLQFALGRENPLVVGGLMQEPADQQKKARRREEFNAAAYTLAITVIPLILFFYGGEIVVNNAIPEPSGSSPGEAPVPPDLSTP